MTRNNSDLTALLDASDILNRATHILGYVLSKRTPGDDQGESWIIGVVEDAIDEAKRLIDGALETFKNSTPRNS